MDLLQAAIGRVDDRDAEFFAPVGEVDGVGGQRDQMVGGEKPPRGACGGLECLTVMLFVVAEDAFGAVKEAVKFVGEVLPVVERPGEAQERVLELAAVDSTSSRQRSPQSLA